MTSFEAQNALGKKINCLYGNGVVVGVQVRPRIYDNDNGFILDENCPVLLTIRLLKKPVSKIPLVTCFDDDAELLE